MITDFFKKRTNEVAKLQQENQQKIIQISDLNSLIETIKSELAKQKTLSIVKSNEIAEKSKAIDSMKLEEDQLITIKSAMDGVSAAIMVVNRDFIVTYVNKASIDLFSNNIIQFKQVFPDFDHTKIVGTCIDIFHKHPQHQRQMLADPSRLPFKTDIRVADLTISLYVTATYTQSGEYSGNVLEWRDVTKERHRAIEDLDAAGKLVAINKIQGVIEFDLTGKIIAVNENFANVTGYSEKEIVGNHHSMFVEPSYKTSHEYKRFWEKLATGEADSGQYKRIGKGDKVVWLQASYNPVLGDDGKPFKVVKFATDITEQQNAASSLQYAVEETQVIIEAAKSGDLSNRVSLAGKSGAIASLCDGINSLIEKMTEVITQVKEAGETINTAAGEISSGNTDLSSRTEQQASSLEETAASMEELASTVKNNAENAKQANQLAEIASGVALKGGKVVGQVVDTMIAINQSAHQIEDIISVIDGIAFQTNILALNAAVEAARAGEQGRGFAVVAGEVRNLAQRSASAAKEIKELITDSVNKTAEGTKQVEVAGTTMQEIVTSVQRVTDIMSEISAASIEQSMGISQVNTAITSMDEVTQQNAALVEEAAAAAESLVDQAVGLMDTVRAFKLQGDLTNQSNNKQAHRTLAKTPNPTFREANKKIPMLSIKRDSDWEEF